MESAVKTDPEVSLVLVDSSAWIDYYRPGGSKEHKENIRLLLAQDRVATTGVIQVEVLTGTKTEEDYETVRHDFLAFHWLEATPATFEAASRLGFQLQRRGLTIPAIDLIIASTAIEHRSELWHRDAHFDQIAAHSSLRSRYL